MDAVLTMRHYTARTPSVAPSLPTSWQRLGCRQVHETTQGQERGRADTHAAEETIHWFRAMNAKREKDRQAEVERIRAAIRSGV